MTKAKNCACLLVLLLLCSACIKEINFELGQQEDQVVIFGTLSDQPGKHLFRVTRTNPFERQSDSAPIGGAILFVQDSKAVKYPCVELDAGTYQLKDTLFRAVTGGQYQLDVLLPGGEHYRSDVEVMPTPVQLDRAYRGLEVDERS